MAYTVIIHISGETSVAGEIEELPKPTDTIILVTNPRQKDGKDLHYLDSNVTKVIVFLLWMTKSAWCASSA